MTTITKARLLAISIGTVLGAALGDAALLNVFPLTRMRTDLCAGCGAQQMTKTVLEFQISQRLEPGPISPWILSHDDGSHEHEWVYDFTFLSSPLGYRGYICARPQERWPLSSLNSARRRLGNDEGLIALVREFLNATESDGKRRQEIGHLADAL